MEACLNRMTIGRQSISGRLAGCSWLRLVMAALGLLVVSPGPASALGEDAAGCPTSNANPQAGQVFTGSKAHFTTGNIELLLLPCQFAPTFGSDGTDCCTSSAAQTASANNPDPSPVEDERQRLKVNPVTGLALASQANYTPLNGSERWKLYLKMTYGSAGPYFSPIVNALLLDQANDTPRQWGSGFPGFGRRLASRAGNAVLQGTFQAPLAALLHEDVRYISTSQHGFKRRAAHALLYSFLTYNDKGHPALNVANLTAFYASTAITTAWLPGIENAARYTFTNASEQIALSFPLNIAQEFWPEIRRYVFRRH
jgi:hypothetical protein